MTAAGQPIRRRQAAGLLILVALFGAIWDFGAAGADGALFWVSVQLACAGLVVLLSAGGPASRTGWWFWSGAATFLVLESWSAVPLANPAFGPDGVPTSPLDSYGLSVELAKLAALAALFYSGYRVGGDRLAGAVLQRWLVRAGALYALWAIATYVLHPDTVHGVTKQIHAERLTASFLSANTAGGLLGALACLGGVRLLRDGRRLAQDVAAYRDIPRSMWAPVLIDTLSVIALWAALLLTLSRTAIMVSAVVLLTFGAFEAVSLLRSLRDGRARLLVLSGAGIGLAVLVASVAGSRLVDKLGALQDDIGGRLQIASTFMPLLKDTPTFGHGLGGFLLLNAHTITPAKANVLWNLGAAHNLILQWWLEAGLGGLLIGAVLIGLILSRLVWLSAATDSHRWLARAALAASIVLLLHSLVDFPLQIDGVAAFCAVVMGLGCAKPDQVERPRDGSRPAKAAPAAA